MPRARLILARGASVRFEPYDRFRHYARNQGRSLESLLTEFEDRRRANLEVLQSSNLTDAELDLPGEHPALGPVSLRQLLAAWVVHDLGHIAQVARVMAKQYTSDVGPWVAFLPVLTDHLTPRSPPWVPRARIARTSRYSASTTVRAGSRVWLWAVHSATSSSRSDDRPASPSVANARVVGP